MTDESEQPPPRVIIEKISDYGEKKRQGKAPRSRGNGQDGDPPKQEIKLKTIAEFCKEYVPLAYLIEPWLRASTLYTLTAVTGHGKTGLLIIIALALVTGRADILGRKVGEVMRGRVAFLTFENPEDVRMRFIVAAYHFNIDLKPIGHDLKILDMRIKPEETIAMLEKDAVEHGPFVLDIVDTFAAFFDGDKINDPVQGGEFMRRMRPMTKTAGQPAVIVAAHPIKNAIEDNLIPYGTGAILNEIDGNLVLWKSETGFARFHWQGKLRGIEFEPWLFRFEIVSSPDVVDAKGREIMLPVVKPADETEGEDRSSQEGEKDLALLLALIAMPDASQRELAVTVGQSLSTVNHRLQRLAKKKLVEQTLSKKWRITGRGMKETTPAKKSKNNSNGEDDEGGEG
jgi:hypothetical protein